MKHMVKLLVNFVNSGSPTAQNSCLGITWKPVEKGVINFLEIGETLTVGQNPESARLNFWKEFEQQAHKLKT